MKKGPFGKAEKCSAKFSDFTQTEYLLLCSPVPATRQYWKQLILIHPKSIHPPHHLLIPSWKAKISERLKKLSAHYTISMYIALSTNPTTLRNTQPDQSSLQSCKYIYCRPVFYNIHPSPPRSFKSFLDFRDSLCTSPLPQTCRMPRPSHFADSITQRTFGKQYKA